MDRRFPVVATRFLFSVTGVFWVGVAVLIQTGLVSPGPTEFEAATVLQLLLLCAGVVMGLLAWRSLRGNRWVDALAVVVAVLNVVTTLTDQVGPIDLACLILAVALLGFLVWALLPVRATRSRIG